MDELGVGVFDKMAGKVERLIMGAGPSGVKRSHILRKCHVGSDWLDKIARTLLEKEQILKENGPGKTIIYKWITENENVDYQRIEIH